MSDKNVKYTSIGGQALIEGVMMRGKEDIAIAVRKQDGSIVVKMEKGSPIEKWKIARTPILRGVFNLVASMMVGIKALTYSAEFYAETDENYEQSKFEKFMYSKLGKHADDIMMGFSILTAFAFALVLFGIVPTFSVGLLKGVISNQIILSAIEGVLKIVVFVAYIVIISQMKDIKRVFQYHGAEHKTIHCFESGEEVTVENARKFTTLHPRCGTSFIFLVLMISIILFTFIGWSNLMIRILTKIILLPLVAGLSYEFIKIAGKSQAGWVKVINQPGLWMQKLTTKEPDDQQLEVAIVAFKSVLERMGSDL
ncbi:DUF1385 domain-containing protein [Fusibacter sp. 3D3]|uniref:DUF1385 domain-containing protein n=1 Tax=Fusibacter sp. 3D3 TaxID=1048380 RepID=UPI000852E39A|nr:DUF1385 domain-containing protein [Fusibacter sp. 3D3]GAU75727.1 hypothetical protein F3D3_0318 [Fusibacter sp. 3D3]